MAMINKFLFGVIGLLMLGAAGAGVAAWQDGVDSRSLAGEGDSQPEEVSNTNSSGAGWELASGVPVNSSPTMTTITECTKVKKDSDEDEDDWEGDDEDDQTEEVCVTRTVPVEQTDTQTSGSSVGVSAMPSQTTPSLPVPSPSVKQYTVAEVSTHNSAASCWSAINGSVYDLTSFVSRHPGGSAAIKSLCGIDGTAAFSGQHGGDQRPASELAGLKIGILAK